MSDIIADINNRIAAAEKARDEAIDKLKELKKKISSNGIALQDGKAYVMVYSGRNEFNCAHCPFNVMTSPDQGHCSLHRDCYDRGGRFYAISEVKKDFKKRITSSGEIDKLKNKVFHLKLELKNISETATKAAKEES